MRITCVLAATFLFAPVVFADQSIEEWTLISASSVDVQTGVPATDGKRSVVVAGDVTPLDEGAGLSGVTKASFGWIESLYLLQTVNARNFRNKHLHVSAFIRANPSRALSLIRDYRRLYQSQLTGSRRIVSTSTEKRFDDLPERSAVTLVAFLHRANRLTKYAAIGGPVKAADEWRRLNMEIGVGDDVDAITIGYYQTGVAVGYVDYFAVVEHGPIGESQNWLLNDAVLESKLRELESKSTHKYEFGNLSFER